MEFLRTFNLILRSDSPCWERLSEKLAEQAAELAKCQGELGNCQRDLDASLAQQTILATRNSELEKSNEHLTMQYQGMLQAVQPLSQSSQEATQWKNAVYSSEDARRALLVQLEEQSAAHAKQMETVCAEIKQSAEDRRTALIKTHVGRLQDKQKEVTELTEELMQLKEVIAAMQKPQADLR